MSHNGIDFLNDKKLEKIIANEAIENVFQSIISLKDGSILGYEALCRGPKDTI
ncbi:MAG: hypothetical protein K0R93_101 [Anaerosolibacter sp.]|jgi:EAL domain-containing protein (putative c-di-GMP-specific phosphodiesterase class I)|uniref:hypothetical protein n=1 Tax=Anaerosolibacter sp. TaxID=1872527 RepID=UPI00262B643B|nr:hypothetical protein [Anaerosolibacter sp.]MDF2545203.1 hypothetical protein [Anaerosolibacter sp.]